jgi:transposase
MVNLREKILQGREKSMQKKQATFTREFKMEAVKLAESGKKPITQIARDLGISDSAIHNWRKLYGVHGEQAFPGSGHQTPQEEEIRQLKRENELLRQERDILKKAIGIFSQRQD